MEINGFELAMIWWTYMAFGTCTLGDIVPPCMEEGELGGHMGWMKVLSPLKD